MTTAFYCTMSRTCTRGSPLPSYEGGSREAKGAGVCRTQRRDVILVLLTIYILVLNGNKTSQLSAWCLTDCQRLTLTDRTGLLVENVKYNLQSVRVLSVLLNFLCANPAPAMASVTATPIVWDHLFWMFAAHFCRWLKNFSFNEEMKMMS